MSLPIKFFKKTGSLNVKLADSSVECTYPSEYFANLNKKPGCNLISIKEVTGIKCHNCAIIRYLKEQLSGGRNYKLQDAKIILNLAMTNFEAELKEDWTSFGQKIGEKGKPVKPADIVQLQSTEIVQNLDQQNDHDACDIYKKDIPGILVVYLTAYRISTLNRNAQNDSTYVKDVISRIITQAVALGYDFKEALWTQMRDVAVTWPEDQDYRVAVAAIDMFMNRFKDHQYGKIRVVTLTSRLKDCTIFGTILWFSKLFNMPTNEAFEYLWTEQLAENVERIYKDKNELDQEHSYTPYGSAMGLFQVSPYSARINPHLHHFVNLVGACNMDTRAFKSVVLDSGTFSAVYDYALFVSYFVLGSTEVDLQLYKDDDTKTGWEGMIEKKKKADKAKAAAGQKVEVKTLKEKYTSWRKTKKVEVLLSYYKYDFNGQTPDEIIKHYMELWKNIEVQDDRVCLGKLLKERANAWSPTV
ncbi:N protein [Rhizoctonia solani rhabdovirus 2]|nr:N protein [Rhizoctonia solani rhabdovirus 2]